MLDPFLIDYSKEIDMLQKKPWKYQINVMKIDAILKIVADILKMAETWMANDISYSGTRQGTFMPNVVQMLSLLITPLEFANFS
jgi:hypothetical protein